MPKDQGLSWENVRRIVDELAPPKGWYRVVLVDKWDFELGGHLIEGDFPSIEEAERERSERGIGDYEEILVYDSDGKVVRSYKGRRVGHW